MNRPDHRNWQGRPKSASEGPEHADIMTQDAVNTFSWKEFERFAPSILHADAAPEWIIESPMGRSINYELTPPMGTGRIEFIEFNDQICVVIFDCFWMQPRTMHVHDHDWIRFNFSLALDITMQFSGEEKVPVNTQTWRIINNPADVITVEDIPANTNTVWVTVCCKPDYLCALTGISEDDLPQPLRSSYTQEHKDSFHKLFEFTSRLNAISSDIIRTKMMNGLRIAYIRARCTELVCLALDHILQPSNTTLTPVKLSASDIAAIEHARDILIHDYASPPSVKDLSLKIGINRNKLYYGFRAIVGRSITDFVQEQRLEEGKRLLQETDLPVSEVAARVGFRHQCNFSTAMKKRYGLTPKMLRDA